MYKARLSFIFYLYPQSVSTSLNNASISFCPFTSSDLLLSVSLAVSTSSKLLIASTCGDW